jgi:hypothetical protein
MSFWRLAVWCGSVAALAGPLCAQHPQTPMLPVEAGVPRLAELPSTPFGVPSQLDWFDGVTPPGPASNAGWYTAEGASGWLVGGEVTYLAPFTQQGVSSDSPRFHLEPGLRLWFGYDWPDCWSVELRYWRWSEQAGAIVTSAGNTLDSKLSAQAVDLELGHEFPFRRWSLKAGGGVRLGVLDSILTDTQYAPQAFDKACFTGVGPTLFVDGRKPLTSELAAIAKVRYSLLLGTIQDELAFGRAGSGDRREAFLDTFDLQLGGEWFRPCNAGGRWFVRLVFEAQVWHASGLNTLHGDLALVGPSLSIGIDR